MYTDYAHTQTHQGARTTLGQTAPAGADPAGDRLHSRAVGTPWDVGGEGPSRPIDCPPSCLPPPLEATAPRPGPSPPHRRLTVPEALMLAVDSRGPCLTARCPAGYTPLRRRATASCYQCSPFLFASQAFDGNRHGFAGAALIPGSVMLGHVDKELGGCSIGCYYTAVRVARRHAARLAWTCQPDGL